MCEEQSQVVTETGVSRDIVIRQKGLEPGMMFCKRREDDAWEVRGSGAEHPDRREDTEAREIGSSQKRPRARWTWVCEWTWVIVKC